MIVPNTIVLRISTKTKYRVLGVVPANEIDVDDAVDYLVLIELDTATNAMPEPMPYVTFRHQMSANEWLLQQDAQVSIDLSKLSNSEQKTLDRRWEILQKALQYGNALYVPRLRAEIARSLARERVASRPFLYSTLRLYWRNGMVKQALVPTYRFCGAPGVQRIATEANKKVGRKRVIEVGRGTAMTREHRERMAIAIAKSPFGKQQRNLRDTYRWMLIDRYSDCIRVEPGGKRNRVVVELPDRVPSFQQFFYYWKTLHDWTARARIRLKSRAFDRLTALFTTGTLVDVRGPGARYYIDATILDLYIVSRLNPNRVICRPTLYIVADQFSRMIVGFYLGLEPPCWVGAMLALWNCNLDKVALCKRYGIEISEEDWPTGYMPMHLMGDRGELTSAQAEALVQGFQISVENARPYAGEAKGVVERDFGTLQAEFGPWLPGAVDKDLARGDADPPTLLAALSLEHATVMVLARILQRIRRTIRDYEGAPEITAAGVEFTPLGLWHWGKRNLRHEYRRFNDDHLVRYLWPEAKLKLTKKALKFYRGLYLMGQELREKPWFPRALHENAEFAARYHPQMLSRMYVLPEEAHSGMLPVDVVPRSSKVAEASHSELAALDFQRRQQGSAADWKNLPLDAQLTSRIADIKKDAVALAKAAKDTSLSKAERLQGIRENRQREIDELTDASLDAAFGQTHLASSPTQAVAEDEAIDRATRAKVDRLLRPKATDN